MTAQELYEKIKENNPDWEPPKKRDTDFSCDPKPFLTQKECELLEMGFKLNKKTPDDHVPLPKEHVDEIIAQYE